MVRTNKTTVAGIILTNAQLFTHGTTFSADVLDTMFGIQLPPVSANDVLASHFLINRRNLQRLTAYTKLNKQLAERGLSITQITENYQTRYYIRTVPKLPAAVGYYRRKGKRAAKRSRILAQAYNQLAIPGIE